MSRGVSVCELFIYYIYTYIYTYKSIIYCYIFVRALFLYITHMRMLPIHMTHPYVLFMMVFLTHEHAYTITYIPCFN